MKKRIMAILLAIVMLCMNIPAELVMNVAAEVEPTVTETESVEADAESLVAEVVSEEITIDAAATSMDLTVNGKNYNLTDQTMVVEGDLYLKKGTINIDGGSLEVQGNVYQTGGTMYINEGTLDIAGDYIISDKGYLEMSGEADYVTVGGNVEISCDSVYGVLLQYGVMEVQGNFAQTNLPDDSGNLLGENGFTLFLNGSGTQKVSIEDEWSTIGDLKIGENAEVVFSGYVCAEYLMSDAEVKFEDAILSQIRLDGYTLKVTGDVKQVGNVYLQGGTLDIQGNLEHSAGTTYVASGLLDISGNYDITNKGYLQMNDSASRVTVGGDFGVNTTGSGTYLTQGVLEIKGDFNQEPADVDNFYAGYNHTTLLSGTELQMVTFENTDCTFGILKLTQPRGNYTFTPENCWETLKDLQPELEITLQPTDVSVIVGKEVAFSVAGNRNDLSYQWQYSSDGGVNWSNCSGNSSITATYEFTSALENNGYKYRCVVSTSEDVFVISDVATLTVADNRIAYGTCGANLTWVITNDKVLTIEGTGTMYNYSYNDFPWYANRNDFTDVVIKSGVTSIGDCAFMDCGNLKNITFSSSLTKIGTSAFGNCDSLESINIPSTITNISDSVFVDCSKLKEITVDSNNKYYCAVDNVLFNKIKNTLIKCAETKTGSYTIPSTVTTIGKEAFVHCVGLTEIIIPNSVTQICELAFVDCAGLTNLTIPDSVTQIDDFAFMGCSKLESVILSEKLTTINTMAFGSCTNLTDITIPESVTAIKERAFADCSSLKTILIPSTVTEIGEDIFRNCDSLECIYGYSGSVAETYASENGISFESLDTEEDNKNENIVDSGSCGVNLTWILDKDGILTISGSGEMTNYASAFVTAPWKEYADDIILVIIGDGVTSIGSYTFNSCKYLESVVIPNTVSRIGSYAFYYCESLKSVKIPNSVIGIERYAFDHCKSLIDVELSSGLLSIGYGAFSFCESLESIKIPNTVTDIDMFAFYYCEKLKSVNIPDGVTKVKEATFMGCYSLSSIEIPDSVTSIDANALCDCTALETIVIPDSVTSIGNYVFKGCSSLLGITVEKDNPNYCSVDGVLFSKDMTTLAVCPAQKAGSYVIPDSVTVIGAGAFVGCTLLVDIDIPDGLISVGYSAFSGCTSLTEIEISKNITRIEGFTYNGCTSLTNVVIPENITYIGQSAFDECTSLDSITIPASVTTLELWAVGQGPIILGYNGTAAEAYTETYGHVFVSMDIENDNVVETGACGSDLKWILDDHGVLTISGIGVMDDYSAESEAPWREYADIIMAIRALDGVTSIGNYAFSSCEKVKRIELTNSISSIGEYAFLNCYECTQIVLPETVEYMGDGVFSGCSRLEEVILPGGISGVKANTFSRCTFLESVTLPKEITYIRHHAFYDCGLREIVIPDSMRSIGASAFESCDFMESIVLPENMIAIEINAFKECSLLEEIIIPEGVEIIAGHVFRDCINLTKVTIPDTITTIEDWAFVGCENLKSIVIRENVTSIGEYAFGYSGANSNDMQKIEGVTIKGYETTVAETYANDNDITFILLDGAKICGDDLTWSLSEEGVLTIKGTGAMYNYSTDKPEPWHNVRKDIVSVVLEEGVTTIGAYAFRYCSSLTSIKLPESLTKIGDYAFLNCLALTSLYLPSNVKILGEVVFIWCDSLTSIEVSAENPNFSSIDGVLYDKEAKTLIICPAGKNGTYIVPENVTAVEKSGFYGCKSITKVELPYSMMSIGRLAFYYCTSLKNIVIPNGVTAIGERALGYSSATTMTDGYIIYGYTDTAAETYANDNGIIFVALDNVGDDTPTITFDEATGKYVYTVNGAIDITMTGLVYYEAGNQYLYFENGVQNTEFYGLTEFGGGKFFVANGAIATECSGLQLIGDNFYFLAYGQLQEQYTGLALYDGQWFYVVDGVLQIGYYGLLDYDGSKFLIATGQIMSDYTGLYNDAVTGNWYYIVYGQVQTEYTGLVAYDGAWFYLVNGMLASDYNGTVTFDGAEFTVMNGQVVA